MFLLVDQILITYKRVFRSDFIPRVLKLSEEQNVCIYLYIYSVSALYFPRGKSVRNICNRHNVLCALTAHATFSSIKY